MSSFLLNVDKFIEKAKLKLKWSCVVEKKGVNRTWRNIAKGRVATPGIGVGIVATGLHRIILKERVDQVMIYAINAKEKKGRTIVQHNYKTT